MTQPIPVSWKPREVDIALDNQPVETFRFINDREREAFLLGLQTGLERVLTDINIR